MITMKDMQAAFNTNGSITLSSPDDTDLEIHINKGTPTYRTIQAMLNAHGDIIPEPNLPANIRRKSLADFHVNGDARTHVNIGRGETGDIVLDMDRQPTTIIFGGPGGGKTILASNIIGHGLDHPDIDLHIMCPRPEEYDHLRLREQDKRLSSWSAMLTSLIALKGMIADRYALMERSSWSTLLGHDERMHAAYLLIDDGDILNGRIMPPMDERDDYSEQGLEAMRTLMRETLHTIIDTGRQAGVFTFILTRHPEDYPELDHIRTARIQCGHMDSRWSMKGLGGHPEYDVPSYVRGRAVISRNHVQEVFQVPYVERDVIYRTR